MRQRSASGPGVLLTAVLISLAVTAVACSSSGPTVTTQSSPTTPARSSPTASAPASGGSDTDLSGTWSGQYSGTFSGTFTLTWQQSGSKLIGTIDLSTDGSPSINGRVSGNTIQFGTVGSTAITYSGSVSGNSMSGTYKVQTSSGTSGGSWSATKS